MTWPLGPRTLFESLNFVGSKGGKSADGSSAFCTVSVFHILANKALLH